MPVFSKLVQMNQDLSQLMTSTHLSLACNGGHESFVNILVNLEGKNQIKTQHENNMQLALCMKKNGSFQVGVMQY